MVVDIGATYRLRNSKRNSFLCLFLLLRIVLIVSEKSTASIEELTQINRSIDRSNVSLGNDAMLNETEMEANDLIISIPCIIILVVFAVFLIYVLQRKQNYRLNSDKSHASGRLIQLGQSSCKGPESIKFSRSNPDTKSGTDEAKPLRNISEESELSRSIMASTSSEHEDENGSQRKTLLEKRRY